MPTLRDRFALAALPVALKEKEGVPMAGIADRVYRMADALVAASVKKMPGISVPPEDTIKKEIVPDLQQDFIALVQDTFSSFGRLAEHCPYKRPGSSYCYHPKNAYSCTIKCPVLAEMESELI